MATRQKVKAAARQANADKRPRACAKYVRVTPRKAQIVLDLIRGKRVDDALAIVMFTPKSASPVVEKLLNSAIANAENNVVPSLRKRAVPTGAAFSLQFVHCFHDHHTPYPDIVSCFAGKGNARIGQKRDAPRIRRVPLCREDILREADRDHTLKSTEVEPLFSCTNS